MTDSKKKKKAIALPVEKHNTAAWASCFVSKKPLSNVGIPGEPEVHHAKEYVDSNEK